MARRRIGILGGSFDPIHTAHLELARLARESCALDEVWLMPCAQQALKPQGACASARQRCHMVELAIAAHRYLRLERYEVEAGGISYTVDTMTALKARNPQVDFFFIMGMDSVGNFSRWKDPDRLLTCCEFIVFDRLGVEKIATPYSPKLLKYHISALKSPISSTELRKMLARNENIMYYIPRAVENYLRQEKIYYREVNNGK